MKRAICLGFLIIINFILQSTLMGYHNIGGITPNLMLILTMSFGIMRGRKEGLLVGFFCGFLADCFFTGFFGPYMLLYMYIGYMNGAFHKKFMVEDVLLPLILITVDDFFFNFLVYICSFLLKNKLDFGDYFIHIILPEMLCTALLTIVVYKIYVYINISLKKKGKE